jgi:hypothetical protein
MRTHPILRDDGTLHAFEVTSAWVTFRPLFKILRSVSGVTDVKRQYFNDDRVAFIYRGVPFVVNEPWGDSSRYWIGPSDPTGSNTDLRPLHEAFRQYNNPFVRFIASILKRAPLNDG